MKTANRSINERDKQRVSLLLTHVNVKSELILSSKPCTNFRGGYVDNRNYSSKLGGAGKAVKTGSGGVLILIFL